MSVVSNSSVRKSSSISSSGTSLDSNSTTNSTTTTTTTSSPSLNPFRTITVTCKAPVNISLTKYWGKDERYPLELNIPLHSSISMTLDPNVFCTTTTIIANPHFTKHQMWLNGKEIELNPRMLRVIQYIQHYCITKRKHLKTEDRNASRNFRYFHIRSDNNFPTGAGLASSASGFAALTYALCKIYGMDREEIGDELTAMARMGSGSATRSLDGGFVYWYANVECAQEHNEDECEESSISSNKPLLDRDKQNNNNNNKRVIDVHRLSISRQIKNEMWWSDLRLIILVVNDQAKTVSSTKGMMTSTKTSVLMNERIRQMQNMNASCKQAILERDFDLLCEVMMKDSNRLHSVCLDSWPPIHYLNDISFRIIELVHFINDIYATKIGEQFKYICGYTFDAGPNAVLLVKHPKYVQVVVEMIERVFFQNNNNNEKPNIFDPLNLRQEWPKENPYKTFKETTIPQYIFGQEKQGIKQIILTKIGTGAKITQFKTEPCQEKRSLL